jgi:hypothetical protein
MAALEKRFPRTAFTRKLTRLCERLEECHRRTIAFRHFFFRSREMSSDVVVRSLWVVGSYARGALDCGDLDVVLQVGPERDLPPQRTITKAFFGSLPYVRYYLGDPTTNTSGIEFPDAVLVWSGPQCDWASAIASIKPNPSAGRAARDTDAIPLRHEQVYAELNELVKLVELRDHGSLEWNFAAVDSKWLEMIPSQDIASGEEQLLRSAEIYWGRKSRQLVPALLRLMRVHEPNGDWNSGYADHSRMRCGGTEVRVGHPEVGTSSFDNNPSLRQIALVPHFSARGPNGAWLIRRGQGHPDLVRLMNSWAFYLVADDGSPCLYCSYDGKQEWDATAIVLNLFDSLEEARDDGDFWEEADDSGISKWDVAVAKGADLLGIIARCDVIQYGDLQFGITPRGERFTGENSFSIDALADVLPSYVARG